MLCYVDDILIVSDGESIERRIISAIQHRVPVKITGRVLQVMRTDDLVPCWEAYQSKKGSNAYRLDA